MKPFLALIELIRVLMLLLIGFGAFAAVELSIFESLRLPSNILLLALANTIVVFILYRNVLQFSGWYRYQNKKLSTRMTWTLACLAALIIVASLY